jgi:hypothetical protein
MEPTRKTAADLLDIQQELIAREPIFHRNEPGTTRAAFSAMTTDDFWEVGASGRRYSKDSVLDTLMQRQAEAHHDRWEATDFHCLQIAADNYLLTYTLRQDARLTRRATLWRRAAQGWLIVYHQGTIVEAA